MMDDDDAEFEFPNVFETVESRNCLICQRPKSTCLCQYFPNEKLKLNGQILIIQHPFEEKRKLATIPLLTNVVDDCIIIKKRRINFGNCPIIDNVIKQALEDEITLYILFPGPGSINVREIKKNNKYVIIAFDGTWREAKEIFKVSQKYLLKPNGPGIRINVDNISNTEGLRIEPYEGCMSTIGAVGSAISELEKNKEIFNIIIKPYHALIKIQAEYNNLIADRMNGIKPYISDKKKRLGVKSLPLT